MADFDSLGEFEVYIKEKAAWKNNLGVDGGCDSAVEALSGCMRDRPVRYVAIRAWMKQDKPPEGHVAIAVTLTDGTEVVVDPTASQSSLQIGAVTLQPMVVQIAGWESVMHDWVGQHCARIKRTTAQYAAQEWISGLNMITVGSFDDSDGEVFANGQHQQGCACVIL